MTKSIVILPPYVEPEHREIIDTAERLLRDYEEALLDKIKAKLNKKYVPNINPTETDIREIENFYHNDRVRIELTNNLIKIKSLCEKPRFLIRK